ncbi:hypothetical protein PAXRUDRAFT_174654, partial [Paxillus rubicundulus Ve08.2h10]
GEYLDIYATKADKAPSMADIRLSLMSPLSAEHTPTGSISWLTAGINIEDSQFSF